MSNHDGLIADAEIPLGWISRLLAAMQSTGLIFVSVGVSVVFLAAGAIPQLHWEVVSQNLLLHVSKRESLCRTL